MDTPSTKPHSHECAYERALALQPRCSLRRYIAVEKFRLVRRKILPLAEAQVNLTDDDIFKALQ
jgi:hypothetical protein